MITASSVCGGKTSSATRTTALPPSSRKWTGRNAPPCHRESEDEPQVDHGDCGRGGVRAHGGVAGFAPSGGSKVECHPMTRRARPQRPTPPATAGAALESLYASSAGKFDKPIHHVDTVLFEYCQERRPWLTERRRVNREGRSPPPAGHPPTAAPRNLVFADREETLGFALAQAPQGTADGTARGRQGTEKVTPPKASRMACAPV